MSSYPNKRGKYDDAAATTTGQGRGDRSSVLRLPYVEISGDVLPSSSSLSPVQVETALRAVLKDLQDVLRLRAIVVVLPQLTSGSPLEKKDVCSTFQVMLTDFQRRTRPTPSKWTANVGFFRGARRSDGAFDAWLSSNASSVYAVMQLCAEVVSHSHGLGTIQNAGAGAGSSVRIEGVSFVCAEPEPRACLPHPSRQD